MSILSNLLDPVFGSDTKKEDQKAKEYLDKGVNAYDGINTPDLSNIDYQALKDLGDYAPSERVQAPTVTGPEEINYQTVDPRLAGVERTNGSAYDNITADPRLREQQTAGLQALNDIAQGGGMTAADQAQLNKVQSEVAQADRGRREAIMQNMQARGMGGSGMELLSQLQSSQAATDRANQSGLDVSGMAQQRALDAIMQSGQLAGNIRNQDYGQQSDAARAKDAISQFNTQNANQIGLANANMANQTALQNSQNSLGAAQANRAAGLNTQQFNAGTQMAANQANATTANQAALLNQQRRQDLSNQNTALRNQQQSANNQVAQQTFQNQSGLAGQKAQAAAPAVNYYQGLGDRKAKKDAAYMDAAVKGATIAAKAF